MSAQMIELLFFAGIAFFIINRLIATLGSTSDEDPAKKQSSFFGEPSIKDVTYTTKNTTSEIIKNKLLNRTDKPSELKEINELVVQENYEAILPGFALISSRLPSFSPSKFLRSAKIAFELIIQAANEKNTQELEKLVDKRYLEKFNPVSAQYGTMLSNANLNAKISEIYSFANNAFIKVLFTGENVTNNLQKINEEWTFSRSLISTNTDWFLTNIDKGE
jgi:predicted lipid-binding transport protein (Tim44 family)